MVDVIGDISCKSPVVTAVLKNTIWINIAFLALLPFPCTAGLNGS
jgi:hypothetical protein